MYYWIARDKNGLAWIFDEEPEVGFLGCWVTESNNAIQIRDSEWLDDYHIEDKPLLVKLDVLPYAES